MSGTLKSLVVIGTAVSGLTACATAPDPAEICSAEWIEPRAERAMERIETRSRKALSALREAGDVWMDGGSPNAFQLLRLSSAVDDLKDELRDGRGIRDLRQLSDACSDPDLVRERVLSVLDRTDIPQRMIDFMNDVGLLEAILRLAENRDEG